MHANTITAPTASPLAATITATVLAWQAALAAQADHTLGTAESAAQQLAQRVAQLALEAQLAAAGTGYQGCQLPCACGGQLRHQRNAARTVRTRAGAISYVRAYYYCRACGASRCPRDEQLGQGPREVSAGVERQVALLGAHLSFATTAMVLAEVGGVALSARQVETVAEAVGAEAAAQAQQAAQQAATEPLPAAPPLQLVGAPVRTFVIEMDGVQAPLQDGHWQEVKCGVVYRLDQRVEVSAGHGMLLRRERCVRRGAVAEFRPQLWASLQRAGARATDRLVVLGDGAEWIDETVAELFPGATRILDFYHVAERIAALARVRYGEASAAAQWREQKLSALKAGHWRAVCRALNQLRLAGEAATLRAETVGYLRRRGAQMAYDQYRAQGLPIGSGAVEGSCKYLVTARCKQAGMRWTAAGLDAILALRCTVLNERLDELRPPPVKLQWAEAA